MGPSSCTAMSILLAMIPSACADCVPGVSVSSAKPIAARTSGGRLVDVCVINSIRLFVNPFILFTVGQAIVFCGLSATQTTKDDRLRHPLEYLYLHLRTHARPDG